MYKTPPPIQSNESDSDESFPQITCILYPSYSGDFPIFISCLLTVDGQCLQATETLKLNWDRFEL